MHKADHGTIHISLILNCCMHVVTLYYLLSFSEIVRRSAASALIIFSFDFMDLSDADVYYCQGLFGAESSFREAARVTVRGINLFFQLP